jgi:hypothetical protein
MGILLRQNDGTFRVDRDYEEEDNDDDDDEDGESNGGEPEDEPMEN